MFSSLQAPYHFNPMQSMFMDPMFLTQEPKRRRVHNGFMRAPFHRNVSHHTPLRFKVTEAERGYVLSLCKELPRDVLRNEINHSLSVLKDQLYRPTYHYCGFFGGLIEEQADEDSLTSEAMSKLNLEAISRRVARQAFKDYKIELNHRGDELTVVSPSDGVAKEFDIGVAIDDLEIMGCQLDESCNHAVWKILLVKENDMKDSESIQDQEMEMEEPEEPEPCEQEEIDSQEGEEKLKSEPTIQEPEESTPLKIDIKFPQAQKSQQHEHILPILEEVEDEEVDRFRQLVDRAPTGSAILEDC